MPNISGLIGYNRSGSSVNKLLAGFGTDIVDVTTGLGYQLNLTSANNVEMEVFLDRVFFQNYAERPLTLNGSASKWTPEYAERALIAKYLKNYKEKSRLYLANCKFPNPQTINDKDGNALTFPSRVFYPDLFLGNNLTWGIEWGTNGKSYLDSPYFELAQPVVQNFKTSNIKVGDPLFITSGNTQLVTKPYFVASVESPFRLRLTENLPVTATSLHYWVGSNWFDVATDDNDQITGLGTNSTRLLIFKLMSLWYYTGTQLRQAKDAVGTSSHRSVINKGGYTYYFHGSDPDIAGIYRFDGVSSIKVSRAIDPYIRGMDTGNYDNVVAWEEGEDLRFFIGDLTNANHDISLTNAVATINTVTNAWDVSPIADVITAATTYRTNNRRDTYTGTSDSQVMKMSSGNSHNGTAIRLNVETGPRYPAGTDVINDFTHLQVIARKGRGIKVGLKRWGKPTGVDDRYIPLGELSDDMTELNIPRGKNTASGYSLQFGELGSLENDAFVEKATMFYRPQRTRITEGERK